ncbi:E3 ubiquitin-protein ligase TRIM50-like [Perca fluviatilis]|uniref:E3 ubiquitin-protein ligase TRIM50-like n=1 Tax=Perca fluviatilis TaxID=8168 RepID=UPI001964F011|nr:E3 ubiquitin-protein ligase TRIM50-like [Perca fluviatilis]
MTSLTAAVSGDRLEDSVSAAFIWCSSASGLCWFCWFWSLLVLVLVFLVVPVVVVVLVLVVPVVLVVLVVLVFLVVPVVVVVLVLVVPVVLVLVVLVVLVMERGESLQDQLRCPVCLDVFTDPLMLLCGHSYCRCCVRSMTMDLLGQLTCPLCRCAVDGDSPRPNVSLARIIEALQEVSVSGGEKVRSCPQHHNPLSLYCEDERTVICGLCGSIGAHRGHQITPLSSVYSRMKEDISCLMTDFQHQKRKLEDQICKMAYNKSRITNESDVLKWVVRKEFGELRRWLEVEEAGFIQEVETSTAVLISSLQNQTDQLNQNQNQLQDAQKILQDLSNEGHLDFITKYGSIAPRFREIQQLQQKEERRFSSVNFITGFNHNDIKLTVWKRLHRKVLPAPEQLKLDPQTAHPMLELRLGDTVVSCGALLRRLPDNPERFSISYCVLANRGFSSGKHYWEVEVGTKPKWRLGLIKGTTNRKAKLGKSPESGVWMIGLKDGVYEAFLSPRVVLPLVCPPRRLALFLDYENRRLTFFNSDSPDELGFIYSFSLELQGKVFPLLDVCWHYRGDNKHPLVLPQPGRDHLPPHPAPETQPGRDHLAPHPAPVPQPGRDHLHPHPATDPQPGRDHLPLHPAPDPQPVRDHLPPHPAPDPQPVRDHLPPHPAPDTSHM